MSFTLDILRLSCCNPHSGDVESTVDYMCLRPGENRDNEAGVFSISSMMEAKRLNEITFDLYGLQFSP